MPIKDITKIPKITKEGNLGIGIAYPSYSLDVSGDINITGTLYKSHIQYVGENVGSVWNSNSDTRDIIYNDGNVGIGVDIPRTTFDVNGDIFTTGTVTASNLYVLGTTTILDTITSNSSQLVIDNDGSGPALKVTQTGENPIAEFYDDNNFTALYIADGGNIGIGTNNTSKTLYVEGDIYSTCNIITSNIETLGKNNIISKSLQLKPINDTQIGTDTVYTYTYNGTYKAEPLFTDVWVNGTKLSYSNADTKDYDVTYTNDPINITSDFTVTLEQTPSLNSTIDITIWPQYIETSEDVVNYCFQVIGGNNFSSNDYGDVYYNGIGNVGVGTFSPIAKVDIMGDGSSLPSIHISSAAYDIAVPSSNVFSIGQWDGSTYTTHFQFDYLGRVGIHTETGDNGAYLHIYGNCNDPSIYLENSDKELAVPSGEALTIGHWDKDTLTFTEEIRMSSAGNFTFNNIVCGVMSLNEVHADDGSQTDPSYTFASDQTTGMFLESTGQLAFTTQGSKIFHITSSGNCVLSGGARFYFYKSINADSNRWFITFNESGDNNFDFWYNNGAGSGNNKLAYLRDQTDVGVIDFTGQHRTFIKDIPYISASNFEGLIVCANNNEYIKLNGGIDFGINAITIDESVPLVSLCSKQKDKTCFGVISLSEDPDSRQDTYGNLTVLIPKENGDTRIYINSLGEGAIWVININGNLVSGDYITTSFVNGYGMKQDDDILHNYTVAKITMDCDFNPQNIPKEFIKKDSNGNNVLNEHGEIQWESSTDEFEKEYNIRYVDMNGNIITEEQYTTNISNNIPSYIAAYVGCTYHCG